MRICWAPAPRFSSSCRAAISCTLSRPCHELTVMEFVKPKPGPVENLFLISGRHRWFPSPVCWGWGLMVVQPAQHPGSLSWTVGGGPQAPTVEASKSFLAGTRHLEAQMGWLCSVVWGTPNLSSGSLACGSYVLSQLCACSASYMSLVIPGHRLSLEDPPLSSCWPKMHVEPLSDPASLLDTPHPHTLSLSSGRCRVVIESLVHRKRVPLLCLLSCPCPHLVPWVPSCPLIPFWPLYPRAIFEPWLS